MNKINHTIQNESKNTNKDRKIDNVDPWGNQDVHIVDNVEHCQDVVRQLRLHCNEYNVIGISCNVKNYSQKIALLQLASHRGLCALIRLNSLNKFPIDLKNFLEDEHIVKACVNQVGENTFDVAVKLTEYGVNVASILDLRYLAQKCNYRPNKLSGLSKEHLKIQLSEHIRMEQRRWRDRTINLDVRNIDYAAKIARVTIELFKKFENELMSKERPNTSNGVQSFISEYCKPHLNQVYPNQMKKEIIKQTIETVNQQKNGLTNQKVQIISNTRECQQVVGILQQHCNEYNVLGFGCKYASSKGSVILLQLASHRGLCALFRLNKFIDLPVELQDILRDKSILKVGDRASFNADRLEGDYGIRVSSAIDIKDIAKEANCSSDRSEMLSKIYFNVDLQTLDWRILNSNWKTLSLREEIDYAVKSVHVMIELFKLFEMKLVAEKYSGNRKKFIDGLCLKDNQYFTLPKQDIRIVNSATECKAVVEQIRIHCDEYNVLGFDCEWLPYGRNKIALLQLATHRGLCALIRLCNLKMIPIELQEILEDETILKVGILPHQDGLKLFQDYGTKVFGILDLMFLAKKCKYQAIGLGGLTEEVLNVKLEHKKRGRITRRIHKKWENATLGIENIKYAANDAHAAVELFKKFQEIIMPTNSIDDQTKYVHQFIDEQCKTYVKKTSLSYKKPNKNEKNIGKKN